MICEFCGAMNGTEAKYCTICGESIFRYSVVFTQLGLKCILCTASINLGVRFCDQCGFDHKRAKQTEQKGYNVFLEQNDGVRSYYIQMLPHNTLTMQELQLRLKETFKRQTLNKVFVGALLIDGIVEWYETYWSESDECYGVVSIGGGDEPEYVIRIAKYERT